MTPPQLVLSEQGEHSQLELATVRLVLRQAELQPGAVPSDVGSISAGSKLTLASVFQLVNSAGSSQYVTCASLATGVGAELLPCEGGPNTQGGTISLGGPVYVATSGVAFAMGTARYIGQDASAFEIALSSAQPGQYALHMPEDAVHSSPIVVRSAMDVTIAGEPSLPRWVYRNGPDVYQFSVYEHGQLTLLYLSLVPHSAGSTPNLWLAGLSGKLNIVHCHLQSTDIGGYGAVSITASEAVRLRLDNLMGVMTSIVLDSVVLNRPNPSVHGQPGNCMTNCSSDILKLHGANVAIANCQFNHVQLALDWRCANTTVANSVFQTDGVAILVASSDAICSSAECFAASQAKGSLTVSSSQLVGGISQPLPCDGTGATCESPHSGPVTVSGLTSISANAPLVCASDGRCSSSYASMTACQHDISSRPSCYVGSITGDGVCRGRCGWACTEHAGNISACCGTCTQNRRRLDSRDKLITDLDHGHTDESAGRHHGRKQSTSSTCDAQHVASGSQAVMDACCPSSGGGHRRTQTDCSLPNTCGTMACANVYTQFYEDCSAVLVQDRQEYQSLYASCQERQAQASSMGLQPVNVQMFQVSIVTPEAAPEPAPEPSPASSAVEGYQVHCDSEALATCVPSCNATTHGYQLLATIDGTDTQFSCNVAHGLYSWMGAASEGGYLGADSASFFSAVVSGAAGAYMVTVNTDAHINTDLVIEPGQNVHISGSTLARAPSWGMAGFRVVERAILVLHFLTVGGDISIPGGTVIMQHVNMRSWHKLPTMNGSLTLTACTIGGDSVAVFSIRLGTAVSTSLHEGYTGPAQCFAPYSSITDGSRYYSNNGRWDVPQTPGRCDNVAMGQFHPGWTRFSGAAGDSLAFYVPPPGTASGPNDPFHWERHCGTTHPGWLSGWDPTTMMGPSTSSLRSQPRDDAHAPPSNFRTAGALPQHTGIVERTVCFVAGNANPRFSRQRDRSKLRCICPVEFAERTVLCPLWRRRLRVLHM